MSDAPATMRALRSRWAGRAIFAAGLAAWVWRCLDLIPYGFHDLRYFISLQQGLWTSAELVHPLFVPLLGIYRAGLSLCGYSGNMLLPLTIANVAAAVLALAALFRLAERLSADRVTATLGILLLAFSHGFWEGALRPDPYSFAAASTIAALVLLLIGPSDERLRYALAGAAAGTAMGFHSSALALVPVAVWAAWFESGPTRRGLKNIGLFLGATALVLALGYALFSAYYGITLEDWRWMRFSEMFSQIEQMPQSSIYTSHDPAKQAQDFQHTFLQYGGLPLLLLAVGALILGLLLQRGRLAFDAVQARTLRVCAASFVFFGLFFLINNTKNGFVYACMLSLPGLLMVLVVQHRLLPLVFAPLAAVIVAFNAWTPPLFGRRGDPIYREARFFADTLRPGDMLIVPGTPVLEILFLRRFNILTTGDLGDARATVAPDCPEAELPRRIAHELERGRRVFFSPGALAGMDPSGGDSGAQKHGQIFWVREPFSPETLRRLEALRLRLAASFVMNCGIRSPQGWRYCRLDLRSESGAVRRPLGCVPPPATSAEREELSRAVEASVAGLGFNVRRRALYLLDWLAEVPGDTGVQKDLVSLLASREGDGAVGGSAETRLPREFSKMSRVMDVARRACDELERGRKTRALRLWAEALRSCEACLLDGLSGFPAEAALASETALRRTCSGSSWLGPVVLGFAARLDRPGLVESTGPQRSANILLEEGIALARDKRWGEAASALRKALESDEDNLDVWMSLGTVLAASGDAEEAIACYDKMLSLKPQSRNVQADILAARANALTVLGRTAQARQDRVAALRRSSSSWPWRKDIQAALKNGE